MGERNCSNHIFWRGLQSNCLKVNRPSWQLPLKTRIMFLVLIQFTVQRRAMSFFILVIPPCVYENLKKKRKINYTKTWTAFYKGTVTYVVPEVTVRYERPKRVEITHIFWDSETWGWNQLGFHRFIKMRKNIQEVRIHHRAPFRWLKLISKVLQLAYDFIFWTLVTEPQNQPMDMFFYARKTS